MQPLVVKARVNFPIIRYRYKTQPKIPPFNKKIKSIIELNLKTYNNISIIISDNENIKINYRNNIIYGNYNKIIKEMRYKENMFHIVSNEIYKDLEYAGFDYPNKYINLVIYNSYNFDFDYYYEEEEKIYLIKKPNSTYFEE